MDFLARYKRELFYVVALFVIWETAQIPVVLNSASLYTAFAVIGTATLLLWCIFSYALYSEKKVSKYSEVLIKIELNKRFGLFFVWPTLLYLVQTTYFYISTNIIVNQLLIVVSTVLMFTLFVHIRSSYLKLYSIANITKIIFTFVDLLIFFLLISSITLLGYQDYYRVLAVGIVSALLFLHQLHINKQFHVPGVVLAIISVAFLVVWAIIFIPVSPLIYSVIQALLFYLIITWWYIRLTGHMDLADYMPPLMFFLMGFIILMSF